MDIYLPLCPDSLSNSLIKYVGKTWVRSTKTQTLRAALEKAPALLVSMKVWYIVSQHDAICVHACYVTTCRNWINGWNCDKLTGVCMAW